MKIKNRNDVIFISVVMFIIISVIFTIILLVNIWSGSKEDEELTSYSYSSLESKINSYYQGILTRVLNKKNIGLLIEKLDDEYLESIKLDRKDEDKIEEYLNKNHLISTNPVILDYDISKNDETGIYIYIFTYRTNGFKRKVYIKETEPYVYTISLSQDETPTSAEEKIDSVLKIDTDNTNNRDIYFNFTKLKSTSTSIEYNVEITNNSTKTVKFDFNNILSTKLNLSDGSRVNLGTVVTMSEDDLTMTPKGILNQYLFFDIPISMQGSIETITFSNVQIGDEIVELTVKM